MRVLKVEVLN